MKRDYSIAAFALAALSLWSCARSPRQLPPPVDTAQSAAAQPPAPAPFAPRFLPPRALNTALYADVMGGGVPQAYVFSIARDSAAPPFARFDLMQAYNWSAADSAWHKAQQDSFAFGTGALAADITRDGKPEIVIFTRSAAGDSVAACGMAVYSAHGGAWKRIFAASSGAPAFRDLDRDSLPEILTYAEYAGVMPSLDALEYVADIYAFNGLDFGEAKRDFPAFYRDSIVAAKRAYARAKTQIPVNAPVAGETDFSLYKPCAAVLALLRAAGDSTGVRTFWNNEKEYLQRMIPQAQFVDLESFATAP